MKHISMFSGGGGSKSATKRIKDKEGTADLITLFTDTLVEDKDTYRYMIESAAMIYDLPRPYHLMLMCENIPDIKTEADIIFRKAFLPKLAAKTMKYMPNFVWLQEGSTPWETYKANRYMGNSRTAHCSGDLKQVIARGWVEANFKPNECIIYVGIDWTEIHRFDGVKAKPGVKEKIGIRRHWLPYTAKAPMTEAPYQDKIEMHRMDEAEGLEKQRMYKRGFAHANCGGFCVRGGQGHFINLLQQDKDYYLYNERKEQELLEFLERNDVSIMTRTVNGIDESVSLKQFREEWESGLGMQIDIYDIGGCGCFSNYETTKAQGF